MAVREDRLGTTSQAARAKSSPPSVWKTLTHASKIKHLEADSSQTFPQMRATPCLINQLPSWHVSRLFSQRRSGVIVYLLSE